jgi:GlpG protein
LPANFYRFHHGEVWILGTEMRLIGHLPDEKSARRFADFLLVESVESQVEPDAGGQWAVWIHDEEDLDQAVAELEEYRKEPEHDKYVTAEKPAAEKRSEEDKTHEAYVKRQFDRKSIWPQTLLSRAGACTFTLIGISVFVFLLMQMNEPLVRKWLSIVNMNIAGDSYSYDRRFLFDVRNGQVWRLFTPMFLHFDVMHIFMNMWLLMDLGGAVERRYGAKWTLALVLVISAFSNTLEYAFGSPGFGGMSGVVFGLFGFVLVQSKYNPSSNFYVSPMMTAILLFWFVFCIVGLPGEIANFVHWGGLASGAVIGYLCSLYSIHHPIR